MLSIREIEEKAKLDNLKQRLEYLDRDLLLKVINQKQYNKEKALISQELYDLEVHHEINAFDEAFNYPNQQIEKLIEEGRELFKWKQY